MNQSKVALVILNYNGKKFLEKLLPSVIQASGNHAVYVADNGSTDDSNSFLKTHFPQVQIISNKGNFGYAMGYNLALDNIKAQYYILINSDVEVSPNWIEPMLELMERDLNIAACQPKLLDYKQRNSFEYAGAAGGFIDTYGYPFCRGRLFNTLETDEGQYNDAHEIFWATGACMMVRSEVFWKVGGFDKDYFAHMEEIDLCWRMKNLGYSIYVQPKSMVYHIGGGTLDKLSTQKTFLNFRNNISTLTKNHPPRYLILKILFRMVLDGVAAFKFLLAGKPNHFLAVLRAHVAYYAWLPKLVAQRKKLKKTAGFNYNRSQIYKGNTVIEYFFQNHKTFRDLKRGFFTS